MGFAHRPGRSCYSSLAGPILGRCPARKSALSRRLGNQSGGGMLTSVVLGKKIRRGRFSVPVFLLGDLCQRSLSQEPSIVLAADFAVFLQSQHGRADRRRRNLNAVGLGVLDYLGIRQPVTTAQYHQDGTRNQPAADALPNATLR